MSHISRLISVLIALVIFLYSTNSMAMGAEELLQSCRTAVSSMKLANDKTTINKINPDDYFKVIQESTECYSYIQGVVDGFRITQDGINYLMSLNKNMSDKEYELLARYLPPDLYGVCLPPQGIDNGTASENYIKFLKKYPDFKKNTARVAVLKSIEWKYPCSNKNPSKIK